MKFVRAAPDVEGRLNKMGRRCKPREIIFFRGKPAASEVREEVLRFKQRERADFAEMGSKEMRPRGESNAQKYLIEAENAVIQRREKRSKRRGL